MALIKKTPFLIFIIAALTFLAYSFVLKAPFRSMDDALSIVENDHIKDFSRAGDVFKKSFFLKNSYYRPLVTLSFMLEYHFFKLNPFYYYLDNIFLHILNAFFVFGIVFFMFREKMFSFYVALLFAIHPVQWEAVSNIPGRSILLCSFFLLGSFCVFLWQGKEGKGPVLSFLLFILALLSKEIAALFPFILFAYVYFFNSHPKKKLKECLPPLVPYIISLAGYVIVRHILNITHLYYWSSFKKLLLGFLTFLRSLFTYLRIIILPHDLHFDRSRRMFEHFFYPEIWMTLIVLAVFIYVVCKLYRRLSKRSVFFGLWFFFLLLPTSQLFVSLGVAPGYIFTAEHFLYLPSVGVFVLLCLGVHYLYEKNSFKKIVSHRVFNLTVIGFYLFLFLTTVQMNVIASQTEAMYKRTLHFSPYNSRVRNALALTFAKLNRFPEAEEQFRLALKYDPSNARARIGLGKALCDEGKFWEGIREYDRVINPTGNLAETLKDNVSKTLRFLEMRYQDALKKRPDDPRVHYSLGVVYAKEGRLRYALEAYKKAVQLNPQYKEALFNLASSYQMFGQEKKAASFFERLVALKGKDDYMDAYACEQLAQIYKSLGDTLKAQEYNRKAEEIKKVIQTPAPLKP